MSQQQMITAIIAAVQTDANLITLFSFMLANNLPNVPLAQLEAMCTALGIDYTEGGGGD